MKVPAILNTKQGQWVVLGIVGLVVVYVVGKGLVKGVTAAAGAAANTAGSVLSGNNALTQGTPYQGAGVAGTLGAAANSVSGGLFESIGNWIAANLPGSGNNYDPNASGGAINRDQVTPNNFNQASDIGSFLPGDW